MMILESGLLFWATVYIDDLIRLAH